MCLVLHRGLVRWHPVCVCTFVCVCVFVCGWTKKGKRERQLVCVCACIRGCVLACACMGESASKCVRADNLLVTETHVYVPLPSKLSLSCSFPLSSWLATKCHSPLYKTNNQSTALVSILNGSPPLEKLALPSSVH